MIEKILGLIICIMLVSITGLPALEITNNDKETNDVKTTSILSDNPLTMSYLDKKQNSDSNEGYQSQKKPESGKHSLNAESLSPYSSIKNDPYIEIDQIKKSIEKKGALWTPNENSIFLKNIEEKEQLLGISPPTDKIENGKKSNNQNKSSQDLPVFFDWRNLHGTSYVTPIRNQESCGSCWAFAATAVLEASANAYFNNPELDIDLSEQDLVSCFAGEGCLGISDYEFFNLFSYIQSNGITDETCFPYTATNDDCDNKCLDWENMAWTISSFQSIYLNKESIKESIITNGPVLAGMTVYNDFLSYGEGIYQHTTESILGYHAVTIVGFGVYDGMDYWVVKNSWGTDWGEDGYFRITAGDSGIGSWFIFAVDQPIPSESLQVICTDNDNDGYYYWGTGPKPEYCPECPDIADCNDSNPDIFQECDCDTEPTGFLNISSDPSDASVFVADQHTGEYYYRGNTPIKMKLNIGIRNIKVSKIGYLDNLTAVEIIEDNELELHMELSNDPQYMEGWPVNIGVWGRKPVIGDLDNDGDKELIVATPDWYLHVFNYDGTYFWGQPILLRGSLNAPAIADLNGDGFQEIIVCEKSNSDSCYWPNGRVLVFQHDGSYLQGWPLVLDGSIIDECTPSIGDIDNDGDLEIVIGTGSIYSPDGCNDPSCYIYYNKTYAIHHNGELVEGWPVELDGTLLLPRSTPVLVDLDGDNKLEVIIGSLNYSNYHGSMHAVFAFHSNGTKVSGFPFYCDRWNWAIAAGDVNNDGKIEILTHQYMINSSGSPVEEWYNPDNVISYLALADINNDGFIEIIYGTWTGSKINIVDYHGNPLDGWPQVPLDDDIVDGNPVVGDIDGDGDLEILIGSHSSNNLYAYHHDGSIVDGFPKVTSGSNKAIALADMDSDGDIELISCSVDGIIYVWDLQATYDENTMEWPMFQHDPWHTGLYNNLIANAGGPYVGYTDHPTEFFGTASGGIPPYTWLWDFGDGNTSNEQNPIHTYESAFEYNVILTVKDSKNNEYTDLTNANIVEDPDIVYVDDDYNANTTGWNITHFSKLQNGINAVSNNGIVIVNKGTYNENINIYKNIHIVGEEKTNTIISNQEDDNIITINADNVYISEFTIQNTPEYSGNKNGIEVTGYNNKIIGNIIKQAQTGIKITNAQSTYIKDNIIINNHDSGIFVDEESHNTTIIKNTINDNSGIGISLHSPYSNIIENTIDNHDYTSIKIYNPSSYNNIIGNIIGHSQHGIYLLLSESNNIQNNQFIKNGILIAAQTLEQTATHTINDNTINGKPIIYIKNYNNQNNTVVPADAGQIILVNSNSILVENQVITNTDFALQIGFCSNITIQNNNIIDNNVCGIYLFNSSHNHIKDNNIIGNNNGLILWGSSQNIIKRNTIKNSVIQGLGVSGSLNTIYHNNFIDNYRQAEELSTGGNNYWDNGYPIGGNYWDDYNGSDDYNGPNQNLPGSDGIGDNPYSISGGNNQDNYPLINSLILHSTDIDLSEGWNWISFNVHPEDTSLASVFGSLGNAVCSVKNQVSFSIYHPEHDLWFGTLEEITDGEMYQVKMLESFSGFTVSGSLIEHSTPITLYQGWNWIAYYPQETLSIDIALDSITENVIEVKSQTQSATYNAVNNTWTGNLTELEPGEGYKIHMSETDTLIYMDN